MHQNPINFELLQNQIFTESSIGLKMKKENGPIAQAEATAAIQFQKRR